MKFPYSVSILAYFVAQAAANGSIIACTGNNGVGCTTITGWVPPNNCNGGCAKFATTVKSVKQGSVDPGYCFTVYTDVNCNSGARRVPANDFINANFKALSYDCC